MQQLPDFPAAIAFLEDLAARPILSREQVGLRRTETLLAAIGHPERRFTTIQVAGSAGKGSTTTMADAILRHARYRTGRLTSPHLQNYRERIAIDGVPIDEDAWLRALNTLLPVLAGMEEGRLPGYDLGRAAFGEVLWAMACLAFVERDVQCVVIEAFLGGRLDPTTVNNATVAVITNVSLDHTDRLGSTIPAIAAEKAGLIKPGQIVISAANPEALAVIASVCRERGATLWNVTTTGGAHDTGARIGQAAPHTERAQSGTAAPDARVQLAVEHTPNGRLLTIATPLRVQQGLHLALRGTHQALNAACAVAAIDALAIGAGLHVAPDAIASGLATAAVPGRLELLPGRPDMLLDGAKSPAGAEALAMTLRQEYAGRRIVLLLGILGDKDLHAISVPLSRLAAEVIVTEPPLEKRAGAGALVATYARTVCAEVALVPDPAAALNQARAVAGPNDLIVVAGSLYLVGLVRDLLGLPAGEIAGAEVQRG